MSTRAKTKSDSLKNFSCFRCGCVSNLTLIPDDVYCFIQKYNNFKWFCDICNNVSPDTKSSAEIDTNLLARAVDRSKQELMIKIDGLTDASKIIESELRNIRCAVKLNDEKLSNINHAVDEMRTGSGGVSTSWTDIVSKEVKKNIDVINVEAKNVQKKLNDATDIKEREQNLVLFRLAEGDDDKERVMKIFNHLTRNEVAEKAVVKVTRLGKKQKNFNEASGKGKPAKIGNEERSVVLGVLNIRSIITKFSSIYGLIHEGLDIFILTESWRGSADNISIGLSMPPGYQFVDRLRSHDPHHGGGTLDLIVTSHNIAVSEAKVYPSGIYSDHGLVQRSSMNFENRWVLRSALNFASDGEVVREVVREVGREFQMKGQEKAKVDLARVFNTS
ncbi:hypothetical protein HELRODRAFT_169105 [Helobdella robusta]|uniref:Uncharacterized protein n=1 Tax=Helobdella robusta TaxID=6412 RepID=T1F1E5_HELRO|nr:hypothetical protein HELRODRAFT_169105 [Helobdella robusta]ESO09160.1 hypothetical protein HELRODRAFT_169105 [Helobdella robusta]